MFLNMDLVAYLLDDLGRFALNGTIFLVGARIVYWIVTDNCDIITKVTPKNYHFILSLEKASGSEPSDSATPPASSEDLEQDSSTDTFTVATASATSDEAEFEFGTISEIAKEAIVDVEQSEHITADAMIEEFAQRAVNGIIDDALKQMKVEEEKNSELLNQPGCSGITPTELYAEKVARTIMGGVMIESNRRRPPPIVIRNSNYSDPATEICSDDQKHIGQYADQMATEILQSALHPVPTQTVAKDADVVQETPAKDSPASRLSGVKEVLKQSVRESGNFLGEGATSPDSGESSPRAPQETTATISQLPPPLPPPPLPQKLPNQPQEVQSECSPASDRYQLDSPRDSSWASLNVPKSIEDIQIDCGQRKYVRIEDASKAMWSALHNRSYRCIHQ
ncbi:uncharacterized protein LOC108864136 [Galendromus occidentalis]|uniref:Uncharacterized protein LOC108864136 n=1 Tax=Galendromus occidentalis TaxID=34638 RepID=A0AAJ7L4J7_9ACAR|nr:uncharacterized protein LOC108864136 [Galendromus occidentalis]